MRAMTAILGFAIATIVLLYFSYEISATYFKFLFYGRLAQSLIMLSLQNYSLRTFARFYGRDFVTSRYLVYETFIFRLVCFIAISVALALCLLHIIFGFELLFLALLLAFATGQAINQIIASKLVALRRYHFSGLVSNLLVYIFFISALGIIIFLNVPMESLYLIHALISAMLSIGFILMFTTGGFGRAFFKAAPKINLTKWRARLKPLIRMTASDFFSQLTISTYVMGLDLYGSNKDVSVYSYIVRIGGLVTLLNNSVSQLLSSRISEQIYKFREPARHLAARYAKKLSAFYLPGMLAGVIAIFGMNLIISQNIPLIVIFIIMMQCVAGILIPFRVALNSQAKFSAIGNISISANLICLSLYGAALFGFGSLNMEIAVFCYGLGIGLSSVLFSMKT